MGWCQGEMNEYLMGSAVFDPRNEDVNRKLGPLLELSYCRSWLIWAALDLPQGE